MKWTKEHMNRLSDIDFAIAVLQERKNTLTNPYSLLNERINKAIKGLEEIKNKLN